jgi:histidinol phosphatase-like enzyme
MTSIIKMKVIYVDIDETICHRETSVDFGTTHDYSKAKPIPENIEKINKFYDEGHTIVYWTARGSRKQIDWFDLTAKQLSEWGAKYHELKTDKPFYDLFIEDKSLRIEEL